jgi:hypothetical protein
LSSSGTDPTAPVKCGGGEADGGFAVGLLNRFVEPGITPLNGEAGQPGGILHIVGNGDAPRSGGIDSPPFAQGGGDHGAGTVAEPDEIFRCGDDHIDGNPEANQMAIDFRGDIPPGGTPV